MRGILGEFREDDGVRRGFGGAGQAEAGVCFALQVCREELRWTDEQCVPLWLLLSPQPGLRRKIFIIGLQLVKSLCLYII
jgi:hypothetical protein